MRPSPSSIEQSGGADDAPAAARPDVGNDEFGTRLAQLTEEVKKRPWIEVEDGVAPRDSRPVLWVIAGVIGFALSLAALVVAVREGGIPFSGEGAATATSPAEIVSGMPNDGCTARLGEILHAIAAYADAHGGPPITLEALHPQFLPFPPVDPDSQRPYEYAIVGDAISLSCPTAEQSSDAR